MLAGQILPAQAADQADTYTVDVVIHRDGSLDVQATIGFVGSAPAVLEQSFALAAETTGERDFVYQVSGVTLDGQPAQTSTAGDVLTVTMPTGGAASVVLAYHVTGATRGTDDGYSAVTWDYLQGLSVPVTSFDATVRVDTMAQFASIDCKTGLRGRPAQACTFWGGGTHDNPNMVAHQADAAAGQAVRVTALFPGGIAVDQVIRERWTLERAFSPGPWQLGVAIAIVLLTGLGLGLAHYRFGRDAGGGEPVRVAEFHPVGEGRTEFRVLNGIRPGHVGTVLDEHVDPVDVTATLLDLAVRGFVRIRELPRTSVHAPTEWVFERLGRATDDLAPYELTLLDAIAPVDSEPATVSALAEHIHPVVGAVQAQLYDDVVRRGWFTGRPDRTRGVWAVLGWIALGVALVATVVLVLLTTYGLVGIALIVAALALLFVGHEMPARTTTGAGVLRGLQVLGGLLATQPTDEAPQGHELGELSAIVPYAVVLGGTRRWLDALGQVCPADSSSAGLEWYVAPETWRLSDLPASLDNFLTTVQGKLFSR